MILFDTTNASRWSHGSGLARVSARLLGEMEGVARPLRWPALRSAAGKGDWILTPELFDAEERPGLLEFLDKRPCPIAAIYYDAIPLKHPEITWPRSVERHAGYMKLLSRFDRVWAISEASRQELTAFWKWQGVERVPEVEVLRLGADWAGVPRSAGPGVAGKDSNPARIVSLGILEPRKNQMLLLDVFEALRAEGLNLELHLVGRVNPHFGKPIARRIKEIASRLEGLVHHASMGDRELADLVWTARATAFPSIAEGFGLPVLESLWMGIPSVCSDIPAVVENAAEGGCLVLPVGDGHAWKEGIRRILSDPEFHSGLASEAASRPLPTWAGAAATLVEALG